MDRPEESEKDISILLSAYQMARQWSGLLVSLSTGAIVFTAIFKRDIAPEGQTLQATNALLASWVLLGIATLLGILYLGTLISQLNKGNKDNLSVYAGTPRCLALLQWTSFVAGIGVFSYVAGVNLI